MADLSKMTSGELRELLEAASAALAAAQAREQAAAANRKDRLAASATKLRGILGSPNDPAYDGANAATIYSLLKHDGPTMVQYAGLVLPLVFEGLRELTTAQLDVTTTLLET